MTLNTKNKYIHFKLAFSIIVPELPSSAIQRFKALFTWTSKYYHLFLVVSGTQSRFIHVKISPLSLKSHPILLL